MPASTTRDRIEDSNRPSGSEGWHGRYRKCATPPLPPVPADGRREATGPRRLGGAPVAIDHPTQQIAPAFRRRAARVEEALAIEMVGDGASVIARHGG